MPRADFIERNGDTQLSGGGDSSDQTGDLLSAHIERNGAHIQNRRHDNWSQWPPPGRFHHPARVQYQPLSGT